MDDPADGRLASSAEFDSPERLNLVRVRLTGVRPVISDLEDPASKLGVIHVFYLGNGIGDTGHRGLPGGRHIQRVRIFPPNTAFVTTYPVPKTS
jgi:hypothetical protein